MYTLKILLILTNYSRLFFISVLLIIQTMSMESHSLDVYSALHNHPSLRMISLKNEPPSFDLPQTEDIINSIKSKIKNFNADKVISSVSSVHPSSVANAKKKEPQKQAVEENKITINLTAKAVQNQPIFHLKFQGGIPFYAVFFHENSWYLAFSYPSNLVITNKSLDHIPHLRSIHHFNEKHGILIKLSMKNKLYPRITFKKQENSIDIKFVSTPLSLEQSRDIIPPRIPEGIFHVRLPQGHLDQDFYDEEDNTRFWVVTAEPRKFDPTYFHERSYPYFTLLESYEGLGILINNDDIRTEFLNKEAKIENPYHQVVSLERQDERPSPSTSIFQNFKDSRAPARLMALQQKILEAQSSLPEYIESAWIYIGLGKPAEATAILKRLKERFSELSLLPSFRALDGLAHLLLGRGAQAKQLLDPLPNDSEVTFYKNIAHLIAKGVPLKSREHSSGQHDKVIHARQDTSIDLLCSDLLTAKDQLLSIPPSLYNNFLSQILQVGLLYKSMYLLSKFTHKDFKPKNIDHGPSLDSYAFYKLAQVIVSINVNHQNPKSLDDFLKYTMNPKISTFAQLEYLQHLRQDNKIDCKTEFKDLETLRFQWRGDLLEYKINTYLADRYIQEKQYSQALSLLRKTLKYFPHNGAQDKLPEKMQNALIVYFKQKPAPPLMQSLSVFQEFGDILPDTSAGDDVMILATNLLLKLKLYDSAHEIIAKYIKEKMKARDSQQRKNRLFFQVALSNYLDGETQEVFNALKNIQHESPELTIKSNLLKSLCYEMMDDSEKALSVLGNSNPELYQQAKIHFGEANWEDACEAYQQIIDSGEFKNYSIDERQYLVINLALCHGLCSNGEELAEIHEKYKGLFSKQKTEPTFLFLTKELVPHKGEIDMKSAENYVNNMKTIFLFRHNILEKYLMSS